MRVNVTLKVLAITAAFVSLAACKGAETVPETTQTAPPETVQVRAPAVKALSASYPLRKQFACLPEAAAMVAAHRGVSKGAGYAENSAGSLKALIEKGILVAEVDVAGLKDGVHILYHDGVWDEKSTGKGPVAASTWIDAEAVLLKDTDGDLTADRPVSLDDVLTLAKDKLYLEIDFKSSAKYETVINAIRDAGMADRVILIAYNEAQARRMAMLAPEMLLSVSLRSEADVLALENEGVSKSNMNAWAGRGPYNAGFMAELKAQGIPVLAWPSRDDVDATAIPASLIVSDYAFDHSPIIGLTDDNRAQYQDCLDSN